MKIKLDYELLDSGQGSKLERYGKYTIIRPSSTCMWSKRQPQLWKDAHAQYVPTKGWQFKKKLPENWRISLGDLGLSLRFQSNGQLGVFPEHVEALTLISNFQKTFEESNEKESGPIKMLNLFAYSGMATTVAGKLGIEVCHVDLAKPALSWTSENLSLNGVAPSLVRLICDDAIKFLEREKRREKRYNIILIDPPSFSRQSKSQYWKLEDIILELTKTCFSLLTDSNYLFAVSCHHPGIGSDMLANLLYDLGDKESSAKANIIKKELCLLESNSPRVLPAGSLAARSDI